MKRLILVGLGLIACVALTACHRDAAKKNQVVVGTVAGPETKLMSVAANMAQRCFGVTVKVVPFSDYNTPNIALANGSLDANAFQHLPYLQAQIQLHHYPLVSVGHTFLYPMALYSKTYRSLSQLPDHAQVAIPNDPSNEARALGLLQAAHLLTLRQGAGLNATPQDVVVNKKQLRFVELDAAELPRALQSVAAATINTNYAVPAGLSPTTSLFEEGPQSPFMNVIVARRADVHRAEIQDLVKAYQTPEVVAAAKQAFGDAAVAGFKPKACVANTKSS